jgi:hypothetical protein
MAVSSIRETEKSQGMKSDKYGEWGMTNILLLVKNSPVRNEVLGALLS